MSIAVVLCSELMDGAGDSIKRDSEATISPLPSIGLARAFITRLLPSLKRGRARKGEIAQLVRVLVCPSMFKQTHVC